MGHTIKRWLQLHWDQLSLRETEKGVFWARERTVSLPPWVCATGGGCRVHGSSGLGSGESKIMCVIVGRPSAPLTCFLTESNTQAGFFSFFNEKHLGCTYHK